MFLTNVKLLQVTMQVTFMKRSLLHVSSTVGHGSLTSCFYDVIYNLRLTKNALKCLFNIYLLSISCIWTI